MAENKYQVPALIRANKILDYLSKHEADMAEIMSALGLPKSTVYSLLLTLEEIGFVRRLPGGQKFTLGFRLFELGTITVSKVSIRDQAISRLQQLSQQEKVTCHLGALDGNEAVYLLKVDPHDDILINSWEGKRLTLNRSAMGKVLLAWLPRERQDELIESLEFLPITPKSFVDKDQFRNHLADVKHQQWAMDDEEDIIGIRCLAAPIFVPDGSVRYSLSVSSVVQKIGDDRVELLRQRVVETARNISRALGTSEDVWS
ncbi:IclR family transcriptional regulator [Oceanidesulfovibrio marinus]|uniref:IclR family transcriptional regulator n=1 Tax=Oceanidesulfovibrio marinus TaxID=370038 RepID=A0ABX6NAF1_9BACT|nr:IclR family transcriptional regulator [Oceanidesulfovibrio marinus]QJT07564.1 IclR family transcriptional regulator [Oceanidesulfovibrio marinus]